MRALALDWADYVGGVADAPAVWWALALIVLVALLLVALKLLGLLPD
jgi:hypothetical protein